MWQLNSCEIFLSSVIFPSVMNAIGLATKMLESPGKQFGIGKAITLSLEVPVYLGEPYHDIAEVVARCDGVNVGFAMLTPDTQNGELLLENPLWTHQRPNLEYRTAVGIEVHPDFRGRGIAAAMLSSAIVVARLKFKAPAHVVARNVDLALGFYKTFGFEIIETPLPDGPIPYGARYSKAEVPSICLG